MATPPFVQPQQGPGSEPFADYLRQVMARQGGGVQGPVTQMGPNVPHPQIQPPEKRPERPVDIGGEFQSKGAHQRASMQNFANSISNVANQISGKLEQRKARQQQQTFDQFSGAYSGMQQAQGQAQQAQEAIRGAQAALIQARQSGDQDAFAAAKQQMTQAQGMFNQAQQALQQNSTILNDISNDPKKVKLISKGFGIDDKNAGTPERQQAIQAIKKSMPGVGQGAANILSRVPQQAQLTPQAQQQQMAQQAGLVGKPATQGQVLGAMTKEQQMQQQQQMAVDKRKQMFTAELPKMTAAGLVLEKNDDGTVKFDDKGFPIVKTQTPEEWSKNPQNAAKNALMQSTIEYNKARTDLATNPDNPVNQIRAMNAEANMKKANAIAVSVSSGSIEAMARMVASGEMAPSQVPAKAKGPVLSAAKQINPSFNPQEADSTFKGQQATETDFRKGKAAQNIRSLNTAIGHLDQLSEAGKALGNGQIQSLNEMAQRYDIATGKAAPVVFEAVKDAVVGEVASTYKGAGATDQEIQAVREVFSKAQSPEQLQGAINQTIKLFNSRLNALDSQYKMGTGKESFKILNDESEAILKKHGFNEAPGGSVQFKVPAGAPPSQGVPDGHQLKMNGQVVAVSKGGQWVAP